MKKLLYQFDGKDAHLFRDNGSAGPIFPLDWSRSGISTIPARGDNTLLTWFRHRLERIYIFSPDPLRMMRSDAEVSRPDRPLHHLASWLRHLSQESFEAVARIQNSQRRSAGGTDRLQGRACGRNHQGPQVRVPVPGRGPGNRGWRFSLNLDQLSEGQGNLVALFTVLHSRGSHSTVCLDEPDNYVALREIQPWLIELIDRTEATASQCLMISHHPELINYLASSHGVRFFRDDLGPVRSQPFQWSEEEGILPAEIVARGWSRPCRPGEAFVWRSSLKTRPWIASRTCSLVLGFHRREIRVDPLSQGTGLSETMGLPEIRAAKSGHNGGRPALRRWGAGRCTDADELEVIERARGAGLGV